MTQTFEAYSSVNTSDANNVASNNTTADLPKNKESAPIITHPELSMSQVFVAQQALLAHETLRRLVQARNIHDTDTVPLSGLESQDLAHNPTNQELLDASAEVAALTMERETVNEHNLRSVVPDNTSFFSPPSIEVASLLIDVAKTTRDETVKVLAEVALDSVDPIVAEQLRFKLHDEFNELTKAERNNHTADQVITELLIDKSLAEREKAERLKGLSESDLEKLEEDDAKPYNPFDDD